MLTFDVRHKDADDVDVEVMAPATMGYIVVCTLHLSTAEVKELVECLTEYLEE